MADAGDPAPCPAGHRDTVKLLPLVAVGGRAGPGAGYRAAGGRRRRLLRRRLRVRLTATRRAPAAANRQSRRDGGGRAPAGR